MANNKYQNERDGQLEFFEQFGIDYEKYSVLVDNTDGIWNGNLFEFKLQITNLNAVLLQAIKYLSRRRIKGEDVPATILLISLNEGICYEFRSIDYFDEIHTIYVGPASKNNKSFVAGEPTTKLNYLSAPKDTVKLQKLLKQKNYMAVRIDEDSIVGWADRYYRECPKASKGSFIGDDQGQVKIKGEIRAPKHFKGRILPFDGKTNERFKYLMDKLNDHLQKKDLGAFFTPTTYCRKAAELLRLAIANVPDSNDYIILDRCAGTGNLESVLTDEELSHCILSTYEYYEYKVLWERLHDKVRLILPPIEAQVEYEHGLVKNADAMSQEYIEEPLIMDYVNNPNCNVIMYENVPYRDSGASDIHKETMGKGFDNYVKGEMIKNGWNNKTVTSDLSNLFIWSAFKYYIKKPNDSYIVFSPIKYWKTHHICEYAEFKKGFLFNRKHFHATASAISCIWWANNDNPVDEITLDVVDIDTNGKPVDLGTIDLKKSFHMSNELFPSTKGFSGETGIVCGTNGYEVLGKVPRGKPLYNKDYFAYLRINGFQVDPKNYTLSTVMPYPAMGRYLTKENYLSLLPLFCAKKYMDKEWWQKDVYSTTADGGSGYMKDKEFLHDCLFFTCLSRYNRCLSFCGSDGREYLNQLCFFPDTVADGEFKKVALDFEEKKMMNLWKKILKEAKDTANYHEGWTYGPYQIEMELDTWRKEGEGRQEHKVYDYPMLHGDLETLKTLVNGFYKDKIEKKLFDYELLK